MNRSLRLAIASVIVGMLLGAGWAFGQGAQTQAPVIISGNDVGFRVDRQRTENVGRLSGTWVVRFNGQWVEPDTSGPRPLTTR